MKPLPALLACFVCAALAALTTWVALPRPRADGLRSTAGTDEAAQNQELARKNEELRAENSRLARKNMDLERAIDDEKRKVEAARPIPATGGDANAKAAVEPAPVPEVKSETPEAKPAAEDATLKATRDRIIADFLGKDQGKADDAMKLLANLAKSGDAEAKRILVEALKSEDPYLRELAVEAIGLIEDPADFALLEAASKDAEPKVREESIEWLANMPPDKAGPVLMKMLVDTDARVIRKSIDALGDMKFEMAKPELAALTRHQDENVAVEAAIALRKLGDPSAAEAMVPIWGAKSTSADSGERHNAVRRLRSFRLESTRVYLEPRLTDESGRVRDEAKKAIAQLDKDLAK